MNQEMQSHLEKLQADLNALKEKLGAGDGENSKPAAEAKGDEKNAKDDGQKSKEGEEGKEQPKRPKLTPKRIAILAGVGAVLLVGLGYFLYHNHKYEETDDSYVQAYATQLSPKVGAIVTDVLVDENQLVKKDQILAQLDPKDYKAALEDATASWNATEALRANAERDFHRSESLLASRVISRQQFDKDRANYLNLDHQAKAAQAKVDQAKLDLGYTTVRAPADGQIARRSVDVGMYVGVGTAIFGFVPSDRRWVDANFKETQLEFMQPGRPAEVTVDAIPHKTFHAVVESVSPATGATFTLMPPDNATGNFTKVVQRVPVRFRLEDLSPEDVRQLQAGLSANVALLKHHSLEAVPQPSEPVFVSRDTEVPDLNAAEAPKSASAADVTQE